MIKHVARTQLKLNNHFFSFFSFFFSLKCQRVRFCSCLSGFTHRSTPKDHQSTAAPYFCPFRSSGAMYSALVVVVVVVGLVDLGY